MTNIAELKDIKLKDLKRKTPAELVTLAEELEVEDAAQRPADQALDLLRPPALLAARRLAIAARVRGAGQHAVFGSEPALAAAALVRRHLVFDRGGAQHLGVAERDEDRALGVAREAALDGDGAKLVGEATGRTLESHAPIVAAA